MVKGEACMLKEAEVDKKELPLSFGNGSARNQMWNKHQWYANPNQQMVEINQSNFRNSNANSTNINRMSKNTGTDRRRVVCVFGWSKDTVPIQTVDDEGLKRMIKKMDPRYNMLWGKYFICILFFLFLIGLYYIISWSTFLYHYLCLL